MIEKKAYETYTGKNIKVLDDIEGVRKRYGMYAGSVESAANHLVNEIIDNSVDEFLNGFADTVKINFDKKTNRITIIDNGRGMPIDIHPELKIPTMEVLVTSTHTGGKFDKDSFKVSSGLNGVGATVVNGLSSSFDLTSFRGNYEYTISFEKGRKVKDFKKSKKRKELKDIDSGTIVSFIPDEEILGKYSKLNEDSIRENISTRSYINAGLKIIFNDKEEFYHKNGIKEMIKDISGDRITDIYYFNKADEKTGNLFEISFAYSSDSEEEIFSFANGIKTTKGTHESGFRKGITDAMKQFITKNNLLNKRGPTIKDINGEDIRSGLVAVVNIRYADADYSAQTKDELTNPELFGIISSLTRSKIIDISLVNQESFKKVCNRIIQFTRGRLRASSYKESVVKVNTTSMGLVDSGKFVDCHGKDVDRREILIIEGDSAGGTTKNARDPEWQAVFPLRGKILNTFGMRPSRILQNAELNNLLVALFGTNDLNKISLENLRFGKIIFLCDADDDGSHINALLTNFFFGFLPELVENGNIYIAQPPKYRYQNNRGEFFYIKNDLELEEFEYNQVKKDITFSNSKNISLKNMMSIKNEYLTTFNNITYQYSISKDILSRFLIPNKEDQHMEGIVKSVGLEYEKDGHIVGIYDEEWHDFYEDDIYEELVIMENVYKFNEKIKFTFKKDKFEMYPIEFIEFITQTYKFSYNYFKGLGEANAKELYDTTIGPSRDIIQLQLEDKDSTETLMRNLFKSSETEARRKLMRSFLN